MNESRFIGVAVAALGLIALFVLIPIGVVSPANVDVVALAPEFWPTIIASVLALAGVVLAIFPARADSEETVPPRRYGRRTARLSILLTIVLAVYFSVPYLGMVLPAMLMIFALSYFAGERRPAVLAGLSLIMPAALTGFFIVIANIPIPLGVFEFVYG